MLFIGYLNEKCVHTLKPAADIYAIKLNTPPQDDEIIFKDGTYAHMPDAMECFVEIIGGDVGGEDEA